LNQDCSIDISAILVSYNTANLLPKAIAELRKSAEGMSLQVIIIDNASRDDSVALSSLIILIVN